MAQGAFRGDRHVGAKMEISKVHVEAFRDGYQADVHTLETARDFFRQAGLRVSGCVTTTRIGKPSTGSDVAVCYTNRKNQERLESVSNEIMNSEW